MTDSIQQNIALDPIKLENILLNEGSSERKKEALQQALINQLISLTDFAANHSQQTPSHNPSPKDPTSL